MLGFLLTRVDYERGLAPVGAMRVMIGLECLEIARLNDWLADKVLAVSRPRSTERSFLWAG